MIPPCCCNCIVPADAPEYENTTKVDDFLTVPDPAGLDPYGRWWFGCDGGTGSCVSYADCGGTDEEKCYTTGYDGTAIDETDPITGIKSCAGVVIDLNCYEATGLDVSYVDDPCPNKGWKGVQAKATWPGRWGFIYGPGCCNTGGQTQTKYRTQTVTITTREYSNVDYAVSACAAARRDEFERKLTATITVTVDIYGNPTITGSVEVRRWYKVDGAYTEDVTTCDLAEHLGGSNGPFTFSDAVIPDGQPTLDASCGEVTFTFNPPGGSEALTEYAGTPEALNAMEYMAPIPGSDTTQTACTPPTGGVGIDLVTDPTSHAAEFEIVSDTSMNVSWYSRATFSSSACCDSAEGGAEQRDMTGEEIISYEQTVTLSDAYTFADVITEAKLLLSQWDLTNDQVLPWRSDSTTWLQPLVTRDAANATPDINWNQDTGEADCPFVNFDPIYSGDLRGVPLPAGYGRHFNFWQTVWQGCLGPSYCNACENKIGELSAAPMSPCATQWTNNYDGPSWMGPGAHISHVIQYTWGVAPLTIIEGCWMQKWAETLEEWPAQNLARPCARDRYLRDETAFACVVDWTDPALEIDTGTEFEIGDTIGIASGVYTVSGKADATHYTLTLVCALPTDITYTDAAKLRFPTARAICGHLDLTSSTQSGGNVIVVTAERHWLRTGDSVDFTSVAGLTTATVTFISDTSFSVAGTLTTSPTAGGYIRSTGATVGIDTYDTTCSDHKFVVQNWQSRHREYDSGDPEDVPYTLTESEQTKTPVTTRPSVLYCTPNSEVFAYGYKATWGSIENDSCYGEEWHLRFVQAMNDPFWQADHEACGHAGDWTQAAQPCTTGADEYAYPPLVEPEFSPPVGAPTPPAGIELFPTGETGMPANVGQSNTDCGSINGVATVHAVRVAWESCTDWEVLINHRCE